MDVKKLYYNLPTYYCPGGNSLLEQKAWAKKFEPKAIRILSWHIIKPAPIKDDLARNSDLMVYGNINKRIGVRIRRYSIFRKYPNQITIRDTRRSGKDTELDKILTGWGDLFFYGFATEDEKELIAYVIINLEEFRKYIIGPPKIIGEHHDNRDGTGFSAYNLEKLPSKAIIERYPNDKTQYKEPTLF